MIKVILLLILLAAGLIAGPYLIDQQGYVLISLGHWTIETSVVGLVISVLILWATVRIIIWLVKKIFRMSSGSFAFFQKRQERKQKRAFIRGLVALDEADYAQAQKQLDIAAEAKNFSGVEYLAAAQAATQLGDDQKALALWHKAAEQKETSLAATLNLVRVAERERRFDKVLALLDDLDDKNQQHPTVIAFRAEALAGLGRWQQLREQLKGWKKSLGTERHEHWMRAAASGIFAEIASKEGANALKARWQQLPRAARKDTAQQSAYVRQLIGQNMHNDAEQALVGFMAYPDPALLPLYKELKANQPTAALRQLEQWLKKDDNNVELLSALGHLAYNAGEYRLADKVIEKRLALAPSAEDELLHAKIKEALQQPLQALEIYKRSRVPGQ